MKKRIILLMLLGVSIANAQRNHGITGDSNWFKNWTNFKPKNVEYSKPTNILVGAITENTTLSKRNTYLLSGMVYVANNAVLTIEPGTVIRGDYDTGGFLVITKGSKIIAEGTETDPIVFTSNKPTSERKPGDWGGLMLMGDAPINMMGGITSSIYDPNPQYNGFGGTNEQSDSGILKYVRIEFAGHKIRDKYLLNGLTLAAVGNRTKIEYVQVSFSNDDSVEAIGGNVNLNNVISFKANDDDYDYSFGLQCTMTNCVAIRYPYTADVTRSRCLEIDSYDKVSNYDPSKKLTAIKMINCTLLNNEENDQGLVKEAISMKYDCNLEMTNCVVSGFSSFLAFDDKFLEANNFRKVIISNSTLDSCKELFTNEILSKVDVANDWFIKNSKQLYISNVGINNLYKNNDIKKTPDFRLK